MDWISIKDTSITLPSAKSGKVLVTDGKNVSIISVVVFLEVVDKPYNTWTHWCEISLPKSKESMNEYTIYCSENQTKRAYKLGAPIVKYESIGVFDNKGYDFVEDVNDSKNELINPTAEQMIGWLDGEGQEIEICKFSKEKFGVFINGIQEVGCYYSTRQGAILGAIDFALTLLENGD